MHFVCVHGVCHGGWCWEKLRDDLEKLGHQVSTPDLPLTSLADDANAIRKVLDSVEGPSVLVGHSYGGSVISMAAADRTDIAHLVYVAAIMIGKNEIFAEIAADFPAAISDHMVIGEDGTFSITPEGAPECFYHRCDPETASNAANRLRSTAMACVASSSGAEPWTTIPSTYVVCSQDRAIAPELQQQMAIRSANSVVIDTDHSPFYSSREELLQVLRGV